MRYAIVELTDDQFRRAMRRGGMMVLSESQVNDMQFPDVEDLRRIGRYSEANKLLAVLEEESTARRNTNQRRLSD